MRLAVFAVCGVLAVVATLALFGKLRFPRGGPARCIAPPSIPNTDRVVLAPMFDGALFDRLVQLVQHPTEPDTWFVVLHRGLVQRIRDGQITTVLDISDLIHFGQQWGLQQIALHPRFPADPRVFVSYFADGMISTVAVVSTQLDHEAVQPATPVVLFAEAQPSEWHPIGGLAFGPDGYLYIGWGFGALETDDPRMLRGKMLRIDVDHKGGEKPFSIPPDNPFLGTDYHPATYAIGFRNPWRFTFDAPTGALWLGDVGEAGYEEIDRVVAGKDYGWPQWEGTACRMPEACEHRPSEPAVLQHTHAEVCAVIGGYVYRGRVLAGFDGKYLYGNACGGSLWALDPATQPATTALVADLDVELASFAEDRDGELYVLSSAERIGGVRDYGKSRVYKLVPAQKADAPSSKPPVRSLASLGCVARSSPGLAAPSGMIEYALNQPAWEDGADIRRFMTTRKTPMRVGIEDSMVPVGGAVLLKTTVREDRPTETQMLARRADGRWEAYLYRWNAEATDALPIPGAEIQCARCHDADTGTLRALSFAQLNRDFQGESQLARLVTLGTIGWSADGKTVPIFPRLDDETASLESRARAYLDVNCSPCHQPGGNAAAASFDLRLTTPLALTRLCGVEPNIGLIGHEDARLVVPGKPERSSVSIRMHATDLSAMPPGRKKADPDGTRVVDAWIRSIERCATVAAAP